MAPASSLLHEIGESVVPLSGQDALLSLANHPLVHFYPNSRGSSDFMPTAVLKLALYMALRAFPLLVGRIQDSGGGEASVVTEKGNLNMPEFVESASSVHWKDISDAHYCWDAWPDGVALAGPATAPGADGVVKLLNIHIVRLAENSGLILFCNIPHYVLDGVGFYEFLGHWATLCRRHRGSEPASESPAFIFDRNVLKESLAGQRRPLEASTRELLTTTSMTARLLAWLSFAARTRLVAMAVRFDYGHGHFFHISPASMDALQSLAVRHSPDGFELPSYALLTALFRVAISQAEQQKGSGGIAGRAVSAVASLLGRLLPGKTSPHLLLSVVHSYELLSHIPGCYIGNNFCLHATYMPAEYPAECTDAEVFGSAAAQIACAMKDIDSAMVGEFHDTVCANRQAYANFSAGMSAMPCALTVIDERHYKTSSADFGDGAPAWISGLPRHTPNFIAYFVAPDHAGGGVNVYTSLKPAVFDKLLSNEFFTSYAKLLY
ncbi:hypothetical protein GGF46_000915 [Coemansia sp. RSA 552]|nr:hypothetical protein GGF46_000915 [Coemansia sp. RSA 552]